MVNEPKIEYRLCKYEKGGYFLQTRTITTTSQSYENLPFGGQHDLLFVLLSGKVSRLR